MDPSTDSTVLPPNKNAGATGAPRSRWKLYAGLGCGCLSLLLLGLVVVAVVTLQMIAEGKLRKRSDPMTENERNIRALLKEVVAAERGKQSSGSPGYTVVINAATPERTAKARKTADTFIAHLENKQMKSAWKMGSSDFKKEVPRVEMFTNNETVKQVILFASTQKRYFLEQRRTTHQNRARKLLGVQRVTYEYRQNQGRRTMVCVVDVIDSALIAKRHGLPKSDDFKVYYFGCEA